MADTLFDKYGGFNSVRYVVADFYKRAQLSPVIGKYFKGYKISRLVDHQTKFLVSIMGGPIAYSSEDLLGKHDGLGVTNEAFDEMARILQETLNEYGFDFDDIKLMLRELEVRRPLIVQTASAES